MKKEEDKFMEQTDQKIAKDIEKLRKALEQFNKSGINREMMEIWICHKSKFPMKKVKYVLSIQEDFLQKLVLERL